MKKIIIILVILLAVALAVYAVWNWNKNKAGEAIFNIETPEINVPFESGIGTLDVETFEVGAETPDTNLIKNINTNADLGVK
jgi:flagellar basal body-associated protein FliL